MEGISSKSRSFIMKYDPDHSNAMSKRADIVVQPVGKNWGQTIAFLLLQALYRMHKLRIVHWSADLWPTLGRKMSITGNFPDCICQLDIVWIVWRVIEISRADEYCCRSWSNLSSKFVVTIWGRSPSASLAILKLLIENW